MDHTHRDIGIQAVVNHSGHRLRSHMENKEKSRKQSRKAAAREREPKRAPVRTEGPQFLLDRQKNKIRGLIGAQRGHKREVGDRTVRKRESIRRILAESRYELPTLHREEFLAWLEITDSRSSLQSLMTAASIGLVNGVIQTKATTLVDEIGWVTVLLARNIDVIGRFVAETQLLDAAFWQDDWATCKSVLGKIKAESGESFWLIDAEVALRQTFEGLESQKHYVSDIQERYKGGLPAYLSFFSSVRNEERSTFTIFDEDIRESLEKTKVSKRVKAYLLYKVSRHVDLDQNSLASILQLESGNSIIDLYETAIDLLQRAVDLPTGGWTAAAIRLLRACEGIGDFRVRKLLYAFGEVPTSPSAVAMEPQAREQFSKHLPHDFWQAAWPMLVTKKSEQYATDKEGSSAKLEALLLSLIDRDEDFEDSMAQLAKFTRNYSFVASAKAAGALADLLTMKVANTPRALGRPLLNSISDDPLDALCQTSLSVDNYNISNTNLLDGNEGTREEINVYLQAIQRVQSEKDSALELLLSVELAPLPDGLANLYRNLILQINLEEGESDEAIRLIGAEVARAPSGIAAVPAAGALADRGWESLSQIEDKIALSLTLYAYWKQTDDSLRTTHLRFSFEDALAHLGVFLASEIPEQMITSDSGIRFFLRYICIPVLMDTSGLFSTTEELLDERLAILSLLARSDPLNRDTFEDEAAGIRASKLIKSGLEIVDSNRVSVDTGALTRWAVKRYRESYNRYQALRAAGIGSSEKFDALFDRIKADPDQGAEHFSVPDNEADSLLLGVLTAIKDRFLNDQQYGLEYFLGKRIRHGTISGHMRGPPESASLITERPGPGRAYDLNSIWMKRLSFKSSDSETIAQKAFASFSEDYDKLIAEARDKDLHVNSPGHPYGLLSLQLNAFRYQIVRSMIRPDMDFDSFLQAYFTILWSLLEPALTVTKDYLAVSLKNRVVQLYGALQEQLRGAIVQDETAIQLSASIQATSTAVQRELDIVGEWFVRGEAQGVTHMFDLSDVLEVAIQSALKSLPNFTPNIERTVVGYGKTTSAVLLTVVDIVFIVFDNIHQRAKLGPKPTFTITFGLSEDRSRLSLGVINPVGSAVDESNTETKLVRIRKKVATDDLVKGAFVEGESGLLKIAAHARHHRGSSFTFDLVDRSFETKIEFPVIYLEDRFSLTPPEYEQ